MAAWVATATIPPPPCKSPGWAKSRRSMLEGLLRLAPSLLAPIVDREAVLARDPDAILIGAGGLDGVRELCSALDRARAGRPRLQ
jgi:hypothetical protein